jgi:uncharacterized membrane protein (UPF0127 family)
MDLVAAHNRTRRCVLAERTERTSTAWERMRGLLGRDGLPHGQALLISPCNSIHMFFMRFAIDVLFLDKDGKIVQAIPRLRPWRATRVYLSARSVLELWAGALEETGTQLGDIIEFSARSLTATSETG